MMLACRSKPAASIPLAHLLAAVAGIYISQTVVTAVTTQALPALLRNSGASLQVVGLTALLWVPWGMRFLWAQTVERWRLPHGRLERRSRTLVLAGQWLIAAVLLGLGAASLARQFALSAYAPYLLGGLLVAALIAASTDVACDGFTVEQFASEQRGWGNVAQVGGSYVGAMLGAGGFLLIAAAFGWPQALLAAGLTIVLLSLPLWCLQEPPREHLPEHDHRPRLWDALRRPQIRTGLLLLVLSSLGVRLTLGMFGPFMLDRGMRLEQLGWLFGSLHLVAGLTGAVLGGVLVRAVPGWRAVWLAAGLQALVLFALTLAATSASLATLTWMLGLMFAVLGCVWVALYSALMHLTSPLQAGLDFTVFQSADALLAAAGGVAAGVLAQHLGYPVCFGLAAACSALACLVVSQHTRMDSLLPRTEHES